MWEATATSEQEWHRDGRKGVVQGEEESSTFRQETNYVEERGPIQLLFFCDIW